MVDVTRFCAYFGLLRLESAPDPALSRHRYVAHRHGASSLTAGEGFHECAHDKCWGLVVPE
jgi:hypothetical protein